jgi:hypothetical protein
MNPFEIEIVEERDILRFTLRGSASHANLLRAVATIAGETKSRCMWLVLCDVSTMTFPMESVFERFEAGVELARQADPRMKMAAVVRADLIDHVFENVARNRGASVATFDNEVAALQWLRGTVPE